MPIMASMKFRVIAPARYAGSSASPSLVLMQDKWNDYGFKTQYQLYRSDADGSSLVGSVKILKNGQTDTDTLQINTDFDFLSEDYVSVGESLDYYARLTELGPEMRREILTALRDVAMHPEYEKEFSSEPGWETSLFRGHAGEGTQDYLLLARARHDRLYRAARRAGEVFVPRSRLDVASFLRLLSAESHSRLLATF
jgi:hypothetical protein